MSISATQSPSGQNRPLSELNTTPLIDVLLVLLVMFIITIPVATHTVIVDLPQDCTDCVVVNSVKNKVTLDANGTIGWNGQAVSEDELGGLLARSVARPVEPELQFEPAGNASYAQSARIINIIRRAGVTKFGFVGNGRYREFEAG